MEQKIKSDLPDQKIPGYFASHPVGRVIANHWKSYLVTLGLAFIGVLLAGLLGRKNDAGLAFIFIFFPLIIWSLPVVICGGLISSTLYYILNLIVRLLSAVFIVAGSLALLSTDNSSTILQSGFVFPLAINLLAGTLAMYIWPLIILGLIIYTIIWCIRIKQLKHQLLLHEYPTEICTAAPYYYSICGAGLKTLPPYQEVAIIPEVDPSQPEDLKRLIDLRRLYRQ